MLKFNENDIVTIYYGDVELNSAYFGDELVFSSGPQPIVRNNYLTFTALEDDTTLSMLFSTYHTPTMYYSADGTNWNDWDGSALSIDSGDSVYVCGDNPEIFNFHSGSTIYANRIVGTGKYSVSGNVMSLLGEDITEIPSEYCFASLFAYNDAVVEASGLSLPATVLKPHCYDGMFNTCRNLTSTPELLATELVEGCYAGMFYSCTSLTSAPELQATTLVKDCYNGMFAACYTLNDITMLAEDISAQNCLYNWVGEVAASGTFHCAQGMSSVIPRGRNGIPTNWTVVEERLKIIPNFISAQELRDKVADDGYADIVICSITTNGNKYLSPYNMNMLSENGTIVNGVYKYEDSDIIRVTANSNDGYNLQARKTTSSSFNYLPVFGTNMRIDEAHMLIDEPEHGFKILNYGESEFGNITDQTEIWPDIDIDDNITYPKTRFIGASQQTAYINSQIFGTSIMFKTGKGSWSYHLIMFAERES